MRWSSLRVYVRIQSTQLTLPWRLGEYISRTSGNCMRVLSAMVIAESYWSRQYSDGDFLVAERLPRGTGAFPTFHQCVRLGFGTGRSLLCRGERKEPD